MSVNLILKTTTIPVTKIKYIKSFTTTGQSTFTTPGDVTTIEILLIAGGGGGGSSVGGGGGAGGYVYRQNYTVTPNTSYSLNVGVGGLGDTTYQAAPIGGNGGESNFDSLISHGGGGGSDFGYNANSQNGGSGGGGTINNSIGLGYSGEGNNGGYPYQGGGGSFGGGGGGAGFAGKMVTTGSPNNDFSGGDGLQSSISGTPTYYSGGGGGGLYGNFPNNNGGLGGGGQGRGGTGPLLLINGAVNTGGGGGGGGGSIAGNGGSGIIIITYISEDVTNKTLLWPVNIEILLGTMYKEYERFQICLNYIAGSASTTNKNIVVKLSGLPFTNVYNLGGKNNTLITLASIPMSSSFYQKCYTPQYYQFTPQQLVNILINLTDFDGIDSNSLINQAIFSFNIIGDENFKKKYLN